MHASPDREVVREPSELARPWEPWDREVKRFLATVDAQAIDRERRIPPAILQRAADLGLFGLTLPEEHGGAGASLEAACRVVETLATVDRSLAITVGLHAGLGTRGLVELGQRSLRDAWLPRMARGETIAAFAATEASAGSDLANMRTVARPHDGGLILRGEKSYVTNGGLAGAVTVLVSSPSVGGARGQSLVFLPIDSPGIQVGAEEDKLGIRGSSTVTIAFDDVVASREQILGEPGRGLAHAHGVLAWGRTLMAAGCVGTARAALDATLKHVTSRRQFGRELAAFGAVREQTVQMAGRLLAMRALVREAARRTEDRSLASMATVAKVFCSEGAFTVCDRALQLHGALGFLEPIGIARMLRDCRVTRIFEGANDVLLVRLGAARLASREPFAASRQASASRAEPLHACRGLAARLDEEVLGLRAKHGVSVVNRQTLLQRVARCEVALEAALATLSCDEGEDDALARRAALDLVTEGHLELDALPTDETREAEITRLSDRLYVGARGGLS